MVRIREKEKGKMMTMPKKLTPEKLKIISCNHKAMQPDCLICHLLDHIAAQDSEIAGLKATVKRLQEAYLPGNYEKIDFILKENTQLREALKELHTDAAREVQQLTRFAVTDHGAGQLAAWKMILKQLNALITIT